MDKREIIRILIEIGTLLEIKGESFFKTKAYYDAARNLELQEEDLDHLVKENKLKDIKGFGEALTQKVGELVLTGRLPYYEELKSSVPSGLLEILKIPGLGSKKVQALYKNLGISSIGELKYACMENRLLKLPGFGEKSQAKILEGIEQLGRYAGQFHFPLASMQAEELVDSIRTRDFVTRASIGGSLRRKKETAKDIDILASSEQRDMVFDVFTSHPLVEKVTSRGDTKASVLLKSGINADLRVVSDMEYPYALHHFTGSKEHNTALRHIAKKEGLKVNEYGIFRGEEIIRCKSEEELFEVFHMQYIPPELRENNGELEAAVKGEIPSLVDYRDVKGIIHAHSTFSDGADSIEDMARYCMEMGYQYLGISDHSKTAYYAGGLKADDIKRQHEEIDALNGKYSNFRILKGIELEILPDGSLDYDEDILSWFDFTIASVHSSFQMDEDKMTERVVNAIKNKYVTILGHPTGRILLSREPFKIDMNEIFKTAAREHVILEINANPHRLDLDWRYIKQAKEMGCKFAICPDAHHIMGINDVEYGINMARKGWLTRDDIVNTRDIENIFKVLHIKRYNFK